MEEIHGLTSSAAAELLRTVGPNSLEVKKQNIFKKFFRWIISPVSLMLLAAALLSLYSGKVPDFWIIIVLFFSNFGIGIWQEGKADKSIEKLQEHLTLKARVFRDGTWKSVNSSDLVPGDAVELKIGSVVPADMTIISSKNLSINESVLTGESLPKEKQVNDLAYSGSFVATGRAVGKITETGVRTFFGKTIASTVVAPRRSTLENDIISISKLLSVLSIAVIIVLTIVLITAHSPIGEIFTLDLSLLIAGIPIALPTVMSVIISIGVFELAKKSVIVRRLASLEDLSNVDLLLSDKTGTLTKNEINVAKTVLFEGFEEKEAATLGLSVINDPENNPLDRAISEKAKDFEVSAYARTDSTPADSVRKRSTAILKINDKLCAASLGAPWVIESLCTVSPEEKAQFDASAKESSEGGYRMLALAINRNGTEEKDMKLVSLFYLSDELHPDAAATIHFMGEKGIGVKMITGDSLEIGERVASEIGLMGHMMPRAALDQENLAQTEADFETIAGFAEVLPKDKFSIVNIARKHHTTAMTGDGINDLPAVKNADVGFAVSTAVDALKSSADIVLISSGISVIKDAVLESRKIFMRLFNYSIYRISESSRLIITIAIIGFIFKTYPLTPVQIILIAFLNDVPIISLAFDHVKSGAKPAHINSKSRFVLGTLFGLTGVAESMVLLYIMTGVMHLPWPVVQTMFFLKLTVSGHMLIYVAHTKERWWKFLPASQVIYATIITQIVATILAVGGIFTAPISLGMAGIVWGWTFVWMQAGELVKYLVNKGTPEE